MTDSLVSAINDGSISSLISLFDLKSFQVNIRVFSFDLTILSSSLANVSSLFLRYSSILLIDLSGLIVLDILNGNLEIVKFPLYLSG